MNTRSVSWTTLVVVACLLVACGVPTPTSTPTTAPTTIVVAPTNTSAPLPSATVVESTVEPTATAALPTSSPTESAQPTASPTRPAPTPSVKASEVAETVTPESTNESSFSYIDNQGFLRLRNLNGADRVVWDQGIVEGAAWSPDGRLLAFVATNELVMWEAEGGSSRVFARDVWGDDTPSWSADGASLAFTRSTDGISTTVMVADVASGATRELAPGSNPHFAPAGTALIAAGPAQPILGMHEGPWAVPQLWTTIDTAPISYTEAINLMDWSRVAWNTDGSVVAVGNTLIDLSGAVIGEPGTPAVDQVEQGTTVHEVLDGISPDGRQIALASLTITRTEDASAKRTDLSLFDRGTADRVTIFRGDEEQGHGLFWRVSRVVWSPDGKTIAFLGAGTTNDGTQGGGIWVGDSAGTSLRLLPGTGDGEQQAQRLFQYPRFSPDGRYLLWDQVGDEPSVWIWQVGSDVPPQPVVSGKRGLWRP